MITAYENSNNMDEMQMHRQSLYNRYNWREETMRCIEAVPVGRTSDDYGDIMDEYVRRDSESDQPVLFRLHRQVHPTGGGSRLVAKPVINGRSYRAIKFNSKDGPTLRDVVEAFKQTYPEFEAEWGIDPDYTTPARAPLRFPLSDHVIAMHL